MIKFAAPAVVLAWTIICLAIAAHFQSLLVITDLSMYAYFVQWSAIAHRPLSSIRPIRNIRRQREFANPPRAVSDPRSPICTYVDSLQSYLQRSSQSQPHFH